MAAITVDPFGGRHALALGSFARNGSSVDTVLLVDAQLGAATNFAALWPLALASSLNRPGAPHQFRHAQSRLIA